MINLFNSTIEIKHYKNWPVREKLKANILKRLKSCKTIVYVKKNSKFNNKLIKID